MALRKPPQNTSGTAVSRLPGGSALSLPADLIRSLRQIRTAGPLHKAQLPASFQDAVFQLLTFQVVIYSGRIPIGERGCTAGDQAQEKQQIHELVDRLAPGQVHAVRGLLQAMLDPVSRAIANAPLDDEPLTTEEAQALVEARDWLQHNRPIPHEQVLTELDITKEEIENYKEPA